MNKNTKESIDMERYNSIMTLEEVAKYLHTNRKGVRSLMDNYGLPFVEISSRPVYRFHRASIDEWFHNREQRNRIY